MMSVDGPLTLNEKIYAVVQRVPQGKVTTYGQVAKMVGKCTARQAGYAMAAVPADLEIPWHRVINAQGKISVRSDGAPDPRQHRALLAEGVVFSPAGRVDLARYAWQPSFEDYLQEPEEPGLG